MTNTNTNNKTNTKTTRKRTNRKNTTKKSTDTKISKDNIDSRTFNIVKNMGFEYYLKLKKEDRLENK